MEPRTLDVAQLIHLSTQEDPNSETLEFWNSGCGRVSPIAKPQFPLDDESVCVSMALFAVTKKRNRRRLSAGHEKPE